MKRIGRFLLRAGAVLVLAWMVFVGLAYRAMSSGPEAISGFMSAMPGPAFMVLPFETLWNAARGGSLAAGDEAPDFELPTIDGRARVRLSSFRGERPVVLVFGSYT